MKAYYLAPSDLRVPRTREPIVEGETVTILSWQTPDPCYAGLHASLQPKDCLEFRDYGCMTVVEIEGDVRQGERKICGRSRKTLKIFSKEETQKAIEARRLARQEAAVAESGATSGAYDALLKKTGPAETAWRAIEAPVLASKREKRLAADAVYRAAESEARRIRDLAIQAAEDEAAVALKEPRAIREAIRDEAEAEYRATLKGPADIRAAANRAADEAFAAAFALEEVKP